MGVFFNSSRVRGMCFGTKGLAVRNLGFKALRVQGLWVQGLGFMVQIPDNLDLRSRCYGDI